MSTKIPYTPKNACFDPEILAHLQTMVKKAGNSWSLDVVRPSDIGFQVVEVGGRKFASYEEPTVAEYTIQVILQNEELRQQTQIKALIREEADRLHESYPEIITDVAKGIKVLTQQNDIMEELYTSAPHILLEIEPTFMRIAEATEETTAQIGMLRSYALCYFLSARGLDGKPFSIDTLGVLTPKSLAALYSFMDKELNPVAEDADEPDSDEGKSV